MRVRDSSCEFVTVRVLVGPAKILVFMENDKKNELYRVLGSPNPV